MQYLIHPKGLEPFLTKWYDFENHYVTGMIIYDLWHEEYSVDGKTFIKMQTDHL